MKVTLFRAFPDIYRQSMNVYCERLLGAIKPYCLADETITTYLPKNISLERPGRYWSQYVDYQWRSRFMQGDINHIIDHAYSHLLHTLNPMRTIITFHDSIWLQAMNGRAPASSGRSIFNWITTYNLSALRKAGRILCVSEASKRNLLLYPGFVPEKIEVVYEGVGDNFFESPRGVESNELKRRFRLPPGIHILHVGHTKFYKNIPGLIHVIAILRKEHHKDVKLIRVGTELTREQELLAARLGVQHHMVQLGLLRDDQLPLVYRAADLLLFPSFDEGFGFPVLEAMASGVPVVASNRGSLPEIVGDAGILCDPNDHAVMAKAILYILENPAQRNRLVEEGRRRAKTFTWQKTAERTLELYRELYQNASR